VIALMGGMLQAARSAFFDVGRKPELRLKSSRFGFSLQSAIKNLRVKALCCARRCVLPC
jgi:hypothetical protein